MLRQSRSLTPVDLASLLFLGAVWGGAFLFLRIAAPEVGPVWAAEIRLAIGASVLLVFAGRRTFAAMRGRVVAFTIVGTTFAAIPFTCIAFASLTLPTGFTALLNAATPLFTAALGVVVLRQVLSGRMVAGLAVGVVAVLVLVGWSHLEPTRRRSSRSPRASGRQRATRSRARTSGRACPMSPASSWPRACC